MPTRIPQTSLTLFVNEFLKKNSKKAAALAVGYTKNPARMGEYLFKLPEVQRILEEINRDIIARIGVTKETLARNLRACAFTDLRDICSWDENGVLHFKPSKELSEDQSRAIKEIQVDEKILKAKNKDDTDTVLDRSMKLKLNDRLEATDMLIRMRGDYPKEPATQVLMPVLVVHSQAEHFHGD